MFIVIQIYASFFMNYLPFLLHIDHMFSCGVLPGPGIFFAFANLSTCCMAGKHLSISYV